MTTTASEEAPAAGGGPAEPGLDRAAIQAIFEERASVLARSSEDAARGETTGLLVLALGDERYGVDMQRVQEIEELQRLTPVPGTPAAWAGLVNLRGSMYPVLDLRRYLSLPAAEASEQRVAKVALVSAAGLTVGLMVDEVPEVRHVATEEISAPVAESAGGRPDIVRGVTPDMLSVLDLDVLLSDPALVVEDEAA